MAFFDRSGIGSGRVPGLPASPTEQFADVTAQEMRRPPGGEFARELEGKLGDVQSWQTLGPGYYETIVRLGFYAGAPLLTVTHSDVADLVPAAPSATYMAQICAGLHEAHCWGAQHMGTYLAPVPGVSGAWTEDQIAEVARAVVDAGTGPSLGE